MDYYLAAKASSLIPKIVILPGNALGILGASFDLTNAVLVFEDEQPWEEQLTVLHEIAHVLDPGWQIEALSLAIKKDLETAPKPFRRLLRRVGGGTHEGFAELASWEMAGLKESKYFPHSRKIVHEALYWES